MSRKTTKKDVMGNYKRKICVPYCDLQTMLKFEDPISHTEGVYGWNADIYYIDLNTVIVTGYRPFGNYNPDRDFIAKYEEEAKKIYAEFNWVTDYDTVKNNLWELTKRFVKEVCGE